MKLNGSAFAGLDRPLYLIFAVGVSLVLGCCWVSSLSGAAGNESNRASNERHHSDLPCGSAQNVCRISGRDGGSYYVVPPADWDGRSRIGALIFFHGYNSSGSSFYNSQALHRLMKTRKEFLVLPNGVGKSWSFTGSPAQERNELVFVQKLVDDLAKRFPIRRTKIWTAGFSMGGSMVWELACRSRVPFRAHVAISGAFWRPLPGTCENGDSPVLHIHGSRDRIVPMNGRPIGRRWHQGNVKQSMQILEQSQHCSSPGPKRRVENGLFNCQLWTQCTSNNNLKLCVFEGGHGLPHKWTALAQDFLTDLPD